MNTRVYQRTIIKLLVGVSCDRIDSKQRAVDRHTTSLNKAVGMLQVLVDGRNNVVLDAIRPQRVVVHVSLLEQIDDL